MRVSADTQHSYVSHSGMGDTGGDRGSPVDENSEARQHH